MPVAACALCKNGKVALVRWSWIFIQLSDVAPFALIIPHEHHVRPLIDEHSQFRDVVNEKSERKASPRLCFLPASSII